jgi:hypothetical protein
LGGCCWGQLFMSANCESTQVTDAGLVHLKGLTKLIELALNGTQVTDTGVEELERALPKLWIVNRRSSIQPAENRL